MAVKRSQNWLQQQRVDVSHLRAVDSAIRGDFDDLLRAAVTGAGEPYVLTGFEISYSGSVIGAPATSLGVIVDGGVLFHSTATEAGTLLAVPAGTADEILNSSNPKVTGAFVASSSNFIALDYTRTPDDTTKDLVKFLDPDTGLEFSKVVPLSKTLEYKFVVTTSGFGTLLPLAVVVTDASNNVTSVTDARPMLFRLGAGGASPDPLHTFSWPEGRTENSSTSTSSSDPFYGADKAIANEKAWKDAVMSMIKEINGSSYWYGSGVTSLHNLAQDRNVHMLDSGVLWSWNLSTKTLSWGGTVTFQIPGSANDNTLAAGSLVLLAGEVAYVTIDRTSAAALTATKVASSAVPIDDGSFVFARRDGSDIIVGTHSFRLKDADASESDYSDHLAKERMFKAIPTPAGASTSVSIYPSQRISCGKRRYTYIDPTVSSKFPRVGYLVGDYDGGPTDESLTTVDFDSSSGTDVVISATLPTHGYELLITDPIAPWKGMFTPVLIAITSSDTVLTVIGSSYGTFAEAVLDDNLPVGPAGDYPVAIVVIEMDAGGTIAGITDSHIVDRRPTGAGGGGGGGGAGSVTEYTAVGGETLIELPSGQTYIPSVADLAVIENGAELFIGATRDYVETDMTHITLTHPAVAGDRYKFRTGAGLSPTSGYGDVFGPGASTDNALARFHLASGKIIQNSLATLSDLGTLAGILDLNMSGDINGVVDITMTGTLTGGSSPFNFMTKEADGALAVGYVLDTLNAFVTPGAKLISIRNDGVELFSVDLTGKIDGYDLSVVAGQAAAALPSASFTDAAVTGKLLTGFVSAPGVVGVGDTILQALGKLDGNVNAISGLASGAVQSSLFTAKGDILVATAPLTPAAVPVGTIGQVLTADPGQPSGVKWSSSGAGNVSNPGTSTDNAIVRFDGVVGNTVQDSLATVDDNGAIAAGGMSLSGPVTLYRNTNLAYAILLANSLKANMNTHAADGSEHFHLGSPSPDVANFPVATADAVDAATLLALAGALLAAYDGHNTDAAAGGGGTYHNDQANSHAPASAVTPTNLDEAVTRLNDLKAKYNLHYPDAGTGGGTPHTAGIGPLEATADATGDYATAGETIVAVVDSLSARTITLSDADKVAGRTIFVKDESGGATANPISVTPQTGTIDGAGSIPISAGYGCLRVYTDGNNWYSL